MGKQLEDVLSKFDVVAFPSSVDYNSRYVNIKGHLTSEVYAEIQAAVLVDEANKGKIPIYLNDHGINHVNMVIHGIDWCRIQFADCL